jgi:NAD(P)-dependent dehydrogenase (short-subunit alcohol dehydrogenase family)
MESFGLHGQVAVVTGGSGTLGSAMCRGLASAGAKVGVLGRRRAQIDRVVSEIEGGGGEALALVADVLDRHQLESARDAVQTRWGRLDILVNGAGGNHPTATLSDSGSVFDIAEEAFRQVVDLNLIGTILPCSVFGKMMIDPHSQEGHGTIITISSMAADRAITRVPAYSAAKAAVENWTRWLAVDLSRRHGSGVRVNGLAPGFFIGEQNRNLLVADDGNVTPRGETIVGRTPAGRFGEPEDLVGPLIWLCSASARFVNGIVLHVDGGFSAFSGV